MKILICFFILEIFSITPKSRIKIVIGGVHSSCQKLKELGFTNYICLKYGY